MSFVAGGYVIAAALAIMYGGFLVRHRPSRLRTIVKFLSIGSLSLLSFRLGGPVLLSIALALSAAGDGFLANEGETNFLAGLGSFLLAHLAYTALFVSGSPYSSPIWLQLVIVVALFALTPLVLLRLWPHLGAMKLPVLGYVAAILAMGLAATLLQTNMLVLIGAIMFMASDIILSHEIFVWKESEPVRTVSPYLIWGLYWGGQALIAYAFLAAA